jgi:polynucleotide 5'-kinase involved in rRNA processing
MVGVVAATARLAAAACVDRLLVNTSGLVTGPGVALKRWKIEALNPDRSSLSPVPTNSLR